MDDRSGKLDSLQVYRGFAALSVLFYHLTSRYFNGGTGLIVPPVFDRKFLGGAFEVGNLGVDFFFVLSGFIIFWIHEKDLGRPERSAYYFLKRFFRIYPVLLAMVIIMAAINIATHRLGTRVETSAKAFFSTLLVLPDFPDWVGSAWTLSHEMLFYGLFLVGILLGRRVLFGLLIIGAALILTADLTGVHSGIPQGSLSCVLNPYNLEFAAGILVALAARRLSGKGAGWLLMAAGIGMLAAVCLLWKDWNTSPVRTTHLRLSAAAAFGCIVLGSVILDRQKAIRWPAPLVLLGDASYSIYLMHVTCISSYKQILGKINPLLGQPHVMMFANATLTVLTALVFWRLFERPVLNWSNGLIRRITSGRSAPLPA